VTQKRCELRNCGCDKIPTRIVSTYSPTKASSESIYYAESAKERERVIRIGPCANRSQDSISSIHEDKNVDGISTKKIFLMLLAFYGETDSSDEILRNDTPTYTYILQIDTVFEIHNCKIFEICIFLLVATVCYTFANVCFTENQYTFNVTMATLRE
jgi:hypothetical protein